MHNRTEEDIIFSNSMTPTGNLARRVKILKIINDPNCHLSLSLQQELVSMVEADDKLRHTLAKQNKIAAKSTLLAPRNDKSL